MGSVQGIVAAREIPAVTVEDVHRTFGETRAVDGVSLEIRQNEFVSLLGPSGCGKTTLLRIIAGLEKLDSGRIFVGERDITKVPAYRRPVNMVFQRYALFPHKTVAENIAYGLRLRRRGAAEINKRVDDMLALVHLPGFGERRIGQLSGGQAQRVALARALVNEPEVLLLDEPLAALDLKLRQAMHVELRQIQRRVGSTFLYVTHDQEEALVMSDRVVLMKDGRVVQDASPLDIYVRPRTLFAARFVGEANLLSGAAEAAGTDTRVRSSRVTFFVHGPPPAHAGDVWVSIRPERMVIVPQGTDIPERLSNRVDGTVEEVSYLGHTLRYKVRVGDESLLAAVAVDMHLLQVEPGDEVTLAWSPGDGVFVDPD